jgi:hypothetical protein
MAINLVKTPPFTLPPHYLVIDVSLWDHHLNIDELIQGGVKAVILGLYKKYEYGQVVGLHDNCVRIMKQVEDSPLILMTYYYYWTSNNPITEANWFVDQMQGHDVKFAWLDAEDYTAIQTPKVRSEMFRQFSAQVKSRFEAFGVYTNIQFIASHAPEMNLWVGKYPAWIPQYRYQPPKTQMTWEVLKNTWLPQHFPGYVIDVADGQKNVVGHQFMCTGILPAAYSLYNQRLPLDVNLFSKDFIESLGVPMPTPEICPCCGQVIPVNPNPPAPAYNYQVKTTYNPYVRYPNSNSPPIGIMMGGTKILVDDYSQTYYAHFSKNESDNFSDGGWIYKSFLQAL